MAADESGLARMVEAAKHRWLSDQEAFDLLQREDLPIRQNNAVKPTDGHDWIKRADGKSTKEAQTTLQFGVNLHLQIHSTYAIHNDRFHRKCYRVRQNKIINMVHYRELASDESDDIGPWMDDALGHDIILPSKSGIYKRDWYDLDDDLGPFPSLSPEMLFKIDDFAPDRADTERSTKVLVLGSFKQGQNFNTNQWGCMFGEQYVEAVALSQNCLSCETPQHKPGVFPFYITCNNNTKFACSQVKEFTFVHTITATEVRLMARLGKLLSVNLEQVGSVGKTMKRLGSLNDVSEVDVLLKVLLKDRFFEWLITQADRSEGFEVLDNEGAGVIHLAAGLGLEWAFPPLIETGMSPDIRDAKGWTPLYWAAYYGREETVSVLVKFEAAADISTYGAAGDLAFARGHAGVAGFLAEEELNRILNLPTVKGRLLDADVQGLESIDTSKIKGVSTKSSNTTTLIKAALDEISKDQDTRAVLGPARKKIQQENAGGNDIMRIDCKQMLENVKKAHDRVQSMASNPKAKEQYWRLRSNKLSIHTSADS